MERYKKVNYVWTHLAAAIIIIAGGCWVESVCAEELLEGQRAKQISDVPSELLLRWKFAPDDVIRGQMKATMTVVSEHGKSFQDDRIYDYRWTVESVDAQGTATIRVSFGRIRCESEVLGIRYDSVADDPLVAATDDPRVNAILYELRGNLNSQFEIQVASNGGVEHIGGAESVDNPMQFTPGDFPALPEKHVKIGDSWSVETGNRFGGFEQQGRATYKLVRLEKSGEQLICHIEGENDTTWSGLPSSSTTAPVKSTSRFDLERGRYIEEEITSGGQIQVTPSIVRTFSIVTTRRLFPGERQPAHSARSGEYMFSFDKERPQPIVLRGVRVAQAGVKVSRNLYMAFCRSWTDADRDGIPTLNELINITTRFPADDRVRFVVYAFDLQDKKLHLDIIDSHGERLERNRMPLKHVGTAVIRVFEGLQPGVYFFEFFVDDRHLVRVPIQVVSTGKPAVGSRAHPARDDVSRLTDSAHEGLEEGLVVVKEDKATIRVGKAVVDRRI